MTRGVIVLLVLTGSIIGAAVMALGIIVWNKNGAANFLLLLAIAIISGVGIPIGVVQVVDLIYARSYRKEMQDRTRF